MAITDWPEDERPREKLLARGAEALSDAELLAIFLRVGRPGMSAVDLARHLLTHFGSLCQLFAASLDELSAVPGMGAAKYRQLQAVQTMARRALAEQLQQGQLLNHPSTVKDYLRLWLRGESREVFAVLFLDAKHRLIAQEVLFQGSLDCATVHPRGVARRALHHNAGALIVAHNHPSGEPEPSQADIALTHRLQQALALIDLRLLDHIVVGASACASLAELGHMNPALR